jgi:hypothetical protein
MVGGWFWLIARKDNRLFCVGENYTLIGDKTRCEVMRLSNIRRKKREGNKNGQRTSVNIFNVCIRGWSWYFDED